MPGPESAPGFDPSEFRFPQEQEPQPEQVEASPRPVTPEAMRRKADQVMGLFVREFAVEGKERLAAELDAHPEAKYVVASAHLADLDVASTVKALGDRLDLQVTHESVLLDSPPHQLMMWLAGKEHFSPLGYTEAKGGKHGVFRPADFSAIAQTVEQTGRTPWIAMHPFSGKREQMSEAKIGPVYLAQKTGAKIIPTALELQGVSATLQRIGEISRAVLKRAAGSGSATYHIGEAVALEPVDVGIIETVFAKRSRGERPTKEERERFSQVHEQLREQADAVAAKIAELLPSERRGAYADDASPEA